MDKWKPKELIRALKRRGDSQEAAARIMGVSWTTVNRWKNGKSIPKGLYREKVDQYIEDALAAKEAGSGSC